MSNLCDFCTCDNMECPLHPTKHDKGCAPCINKNLVLKEVPNCFFNLLNGAKARKGDTFRDFAQLVISSEHRLSEDYD